MFSFNRNWLVLISLTICQLNLIHGFKYEEAEKMLKAFRDKENIFQADSGNSSVTLSVCPYDPKDLKRIVVSATRAMDFYENYLGNLVMDAAIGTRIMEAQLMLLQAGHQRLPQSLQLYFLTLQFKSELLSEEIIDQFTNKMLANEATETEKQKFLQQINWINNVSLWETPELKRWPGKDHDLLGKARGLNVSSAAILLLVDESMDEDISDACINQIFDNCNPTQDCVKIFMEKPHSKYSLTHQVIFYLIAKQQKCFNNAQFKQKTANNTEPTEFVKIMCDKIWEEANAIEASGYPIVFRDLLAEQITVCSLAGYEQFLKHQWLENILSWQSEDDSSGCFLSAREPTSAGQSESEELEMEGLNVGGKYGKMYQKYLRRKKRSENIMTVGDDNCSVHFTAVCLGALAMHLRYFADTCLRNY